LTIIVTFTCSSLVFAFVATMAEGVLPGLQCLGCARVNTSRAKFCNFCGGTLETATPAALGPPSLKSIKNIARPDAPQKVKLVVKLVSAQGLRPADLALLGGSSDPFCICRVPERPETQVQTQHVNKTLQPEWNEEHVMRNYAEGENLEFLVMDYDKGSDADLLGQVVLECKEFDREGGFVGSLALTDCGKGFAATLRVQVEVVRFTPDPPISQFGSRLQVTMQSAKGLRAADWSIGGGRSDPFCTCEVEGKPHIKLETNYIDKTLEPVWDEVHEIPNYEYGDCLVFRVYDHDRGSDADLLGRSIVLDGTDFDRDGGFDDELKLLECGVGNNATLKVKIEILPPLMPDAPPVSQPGSRLSVTILSAKGLRAADWSFMGGGKSDPFCRCEIQDNPEFMFETIYIEKTLQPVWNEEHEFPCYTRGDNLDFQVFDYDKGSAADLLGKITLAGRDFDRDGGFEGELKLLQCGRGPQATLKVKVEVLPPLMPDAPPISEPGSRLQVTILSAKGLRAADWSLMGGGKSDPFCRCEIRGKPEFMFETLHIEKTLEPVWAEQHEIACYEKGDDLDFRVFDYDKGSAADLLGRITLASRNFDREGGFEGELRLLECGRGPQSSLKVKVEMLPPLLPDAPPVSEPGSRLKVTILSATGLRAADWGFMGGGKSDPFCRCEIRDKPEFKFETRHINKTLDPVWNEEHELPVYAQGDDLDFQVFDYDRGSAADLLGRITLAGRDFDREGGFEGELRLLESGKGSQAKLSVRVEVLPPLLAAAPPVSEPGSRLSITVISAEGLRAADWGGKSDPFCICQVVGKPETQFKTAHISKTLAPVWDETHEIDEYQQGDSLEFQVFDYDRGSAADLLGKALLLFNVFDREGGFHGELKLTECGKGKTATIKVHVRVLPPPWPLAPPISEPGSRLKVSILSATGLRAADWSLLGSGSSDPYCVCELRGKPSSAAQTRHIAKTLEPQWDEIHELDDYEHGDVLEFTVFDHDYGSASDLLGKAILPCMAFDREGGFDGQLKLRESGKDSTATLTVRVEVLSVALLPKAPPVSVAGSRLRVVVRSASGLRAADFSFGGGKSDPFCICQIRGKPDLKIQTRHISKTLEPVWEEEHEFDLYELGDSLEFTVFDHDKGSASDLLGKVTLASGDFDRAGGFEGELKLRECGKGYSAVLSVAVEVLPPETPEAPPISVPGSMLKVFIISAKGLRAADWSLRGGGKSDPYCVCEIKGKPSSKCTTRHIRKTLSPTWKEEHDIHDYVHGDALEFTVFDYDAGSAADLLGKAVLHCREFDRDGGFTGDLRLRECGVGRSAWLTVQVHVELPSPSATPISVPGSRLRIAIVRANGLRVADWGIGGGSSDPFCRCEIQGRTETRVETKHINKNLNPVWNQEFEMKEFQREDCLVFTVMDYDRASSADLLGRVALAAREFDRAEGYAGTLKLRDSGNGPPATLTVRVEVLPPLRPSSAEPGCSLRVLVRCARGLAACAGMPDPFCVCMLRDKPHTRRQTRTLKGTAAPTWHEEHRIRSYSPGDRLECIVLDHDVGEEADLLGRVSLESMHFDCAGGFDGELTLHECRKGSLATLSLQVEVLPPGRLPLVIMVFAASNLPDSEETSGFVCTCHPAGRPHFRARTSERKIAPPPVCTWTEELHMSEYVEGDAVEFQVLRQDKELMLHEIGVASVQHTAIQDACGFAGKLHLMNSRGRNAGILNVRIENIHQWENRRQAEEEERRAREEKAREAERQRREREELERRRAQEEADEQARKEAERRAAEKAARRAQALACEVVIPVLLWPGDEVIAQISILGGATVLELARRAARSAKLPLCPRMRVGGRLPSEAELLWDVGACDSASRVFAEVCPTILTCSADFTAKVWNAGTGQCELTVASQEGVSHDGAVNSACATPDLKWIATASDDCTAKVWVVDGVMRVVSVAWTLVGHTKPVYSACFSQDGRFVVTASGDGTAKIWRMRTGQCVHTLEGHSGEVLSATFTPDGMLVRTVGHDRSMKTWEAETGRCRGTVMGQDPAQAMSFTPDGKLFLIVARCSEVEVRCMTTGASKQILRGHAGQVTWASFIALRAPHVSLTALRSGKLGMSDKATAAPMLKRSLSASASLILSPCQSSRAGSAAPSPSSCVRGLSSSDRGEFERRSRSRRSPSGTAAKGGRSK